MGFRVYFFYLSCEAIGTAVTPGLLCQPRVITKMIMEKQMECRLAGETEVLGGNCPSATFVHHKIPHDQTRVWTWAAAVGIEFTWYSSLLSPSFDGFGIRTHPTAQYHLSSYAIEGYYVQQIHKDWQRLKNNRFLCYFISRTDYRVPSDNKNWSNLLGPSAMPFGSETSENFKQLKWLIAREDFISFNRREIFKTNKNITTTVNCQACSMRLVLIYFTML
jgi:hypothetical protein